MTTCRAMMLVALLAAGVAARAADAKFTVADVHLGGPIAGPDVSAEALAGKVVLLEFWGRECPPCATTMPFLERMHRTLAPQGLLIVAAHAQPGTPDEVRRAAAGLGVSFSVIDQSGVQGLERLPTLPYTLVFDHSGACVFQGSALDATAAVTAAVNASPPTLLNGRSLERLAGLYPLLKSDAGLATALKTARGLFTSKDEATADEARFVVEKIEAWGRDIVDQGPATREIDPARALERLQACAATFKGEPLGKEATQMMIAWRKDPTFQMALKCGQQLAQLEAQRTALLGGGKVVTPDAVAAVPAATKQGMKQLVDAVQKGVPGSKMAERAGEIAMEWNLSAGGGK